MNKRELVEAVSKRSSVERAKVERVFTAINNVIVEVLNKGGEVSIRNFGKFKAGETKERLYQNPITKRRFYSCPKKQIFVRLFKNFKYSIK